MSENKYILNPISDLEKCLLLSEELRKTLRSTGHNTLQKLFALLYAMDEVHSINFFKSFGVNPVELKENLETLLDKDTIDKIKNYKPTQYAMGCILENEA